MKRCTAGVLVLSIAFWSAGCADEDCMSSPAIDVVLEIEGVDTTERFVLLDFMATVQSAGDGVLALSADDGPVTVRYNIGSYSLPVAAGDVVRVVWRQIQPFGTTHGLALWTPEGRLLALIDDGRFSSAWIGGPDPQPDLGGFDFLFETVGCPAIQTECFRSTRLGLRFRHVSGSSVMVHPGESGTLTNDSGHLFRAVNAYVENISEVQCGDVSARIAWFVLADKDE